MLPILVRAAGRPTTIAFAAGLLVGLLVASSATTYLLPPGSEEAFITTRVVRVIDGDTVELASGQRVRYVGLDTPEMGKERECGAQEATDFNRRLVEGKQVKLLEGPEDTDSLRQIVALRLRGRSFRQRRACEDGTRHSQAIPSRGTLWQAVRPAGAERQGGRSWVLG